MVTIGSERPKFLRRIGLAAVFALALPPLGDAALDPATLCDDAALAAARQSGVPLPVLQAIALAESGRTSGGRQRPWPWTVNFGGEGFWYASREEAELAATERQSMGATNFDLGCFQLNHRWHGDAFPSIAAMLDPVQNALYAAQFLRQLYQETGTWPDAAAAYHSRTPELAERYRAHFEALRDGLQSADPTLLAALPRRNGFPLLQAGIAGSLGSLVPLLGGGPGLFAAAP